MDKLKAEKLFGGALVPVTGSLVERYNQCLTMIGQTPTGLDGFSVDGIGWSPEIAEEKNDLYYLNNGEANPHAIIISPMQKGRPVYVPFHSFDREIMAIIFDTYSAVLKDITKDGAVCVDLDQYIDAFYEPFDLLKYKNISVGFKLLNELDKVQKEQQDLITHFNEGNNFIDEEIHIQLLASARKYGDLRKRKLSLKPIDYKTSSFYTRAFGGVFIIRKFARPIMIFESREWHQKAIQDTLHDVLIYHIQDRELIAQLEKNILIDYNLKKVVETERYERIKKHILIEQLEEIEHSTEEIISNQILFKSYLNKMDISRRNIVMGVERYNEKVLIDKQLNVYDHIDHQFFHALCEPHATLSEKQKDLIWKLLIKIAPKDPLFLYWYDKESFYETYKKWDSSYQEWIIDYIKEQHKNEES